MQFQTARNHFIYVTSYAGEVTQSRSHVTESRDECYSISFYYENIKAVVMSSSNNATTEQLVHIRYYPEDGPSNPWMYGVILAGSSFILFVAIVIFKLCRSTYQSSTGLKSSTYVAATRRRSTLLLSSNEMIPMCKHAPRSNSKAIEFV